MIIGFSMFLVLAAACSGEPVASKVAPEVGQRAPSFDARFVGGDTARLDDLLGNGVILSFWSTWCAPCRRELPLLDRVAWEGVDNRVTLIAVNMGEPVDDVREFLDDLDLTIPVVLDTGGHIRRAYAVPALPMTFFIDGNGVIQYRRVGELREGHVAEALARMKNP